MDSKVEWTIYNELCAITVKANRFNPEEYKKLDESVKYLENYLVLTEDHLDRMKHMAKNFIGKKQSVRDGLKYIQIAQYIVDLKWENPFFINEEILDFITEMEMPF